MCLFICAMQKKKEHKIMRKSMRNKTTSHNHYSDLVSTRKHGNLFARWRLHTSTVWAWVAKWSFSCSVTCHTQRPQWLAFIVCVKMTIHTLSVSTGDRVHASRQYMHPHIKQHTHIHSLHKEDNTHRSLGGNDTNKHAQLTD